MFHVDISLKLVTIELYNMSSEIGSRGYFEGDVNLVVY